MIISPIVLWSLNSILTVLFLSWSQTESFGCDISFSLWWKYSCKWERLIDVVYLLSKVFECMQLDQLNTCIYIVWKKKNNNNNNNWYCRSSPDKPKRLLHELYSVHLTDNKLSTWLWWWLPLSLSKHPSLLTTSFLSWLTSLRRSGYTITQNDCCCYLTSDIIVV